MDKTVKTPAYEHEGDSGFDVFSFEEVKLEPLERKLVRTGLQIEMPKGLEAQVRPKSGLAINHGITILNTPGTIDSSYRGEVKVIVINLGKKEYTIVKNQKIAQIVFCAVEKPEIVQTTELSKTSRNSGGFGSTGVL